MIWRSVNLSVSVSRFSWFVALFVLFAGNRDERTTWRIKKWDKTQQFGLLRFWLCWMIWPSFCFLRLIIYRFSSFYIFLITHCFPFSVSIPPSPISHCCIPFSQTFIFKISVSPFPLPIKIPRLCFKFRLVTKDELIESKNLFRIEIFSESFSYSWFSKKLKKKLFEYNKFLPLVVLQPRRWATHSPPVWRDHPHSDGRKYPSTRLRDRSCCSRNSCSSNGGNAVASKPVHFSCCCRRSSSGKCAQRQTADRRGSTSRRGSAHPVFHVRCF